jgi:hypothetical protein
MRHFQVERCILSQRAFCPHVLADALYCFAHQHQAHPSARKIFSTIQALEDPKDALGHRLDKRAGQTNYTPTRDNTVQVQCECTARMQLERVSVHLQRML